MTPRLPTFGLRVTFQYMGHKQTDWRAALVEGVTGPMVAILFWVTMIVIVVMSLAHSEAFETNVFEAIGALGQLIFGVGVLWVAWQQFQYTQRMTERQHRIDTYTIRKASLDQFLTMFDVLEKRANSGLPFGSDFLDAWLELETDVTRVFSDKPGGHIIEMLRLISRCDDGSTWRADLIKKHGDDIEAIKAELRENWKEISMHRFEAWHAMHKELSLRPE